MSVLIVISQLTSAVKDRQGTVRVTVDIYFCPDVMTATLIRRNLERNVVKGHAIVRRDSPLMVFTENVL